MSRKKKLHQFKRENVSGEHKILPNNNFIPVRWDNIDSDRQLMACPYTEFIPLSYIMLSSGVYKCSNIGEHCRQNWGIKERNSKKLTKFNNRWQNKQLSVFATAGMSGEGREISKENTKRRLINWLFEDRVQHLNYLERGGWKLNYRPKIVESFKEGKTCGFTQRSYRGEISAYSLFLKNDNNNCIPHMLAVVLPENYMYVKYHLMVYDTIPLDKVIVLINKDLDSTSFRPAAFRTLYRELMFHVLKSACQVWKVPHEFILENCFLHSYKLKEENIIKRKKETEELIGEFYDSINNGDESNAAPLRFTGGTLTTSSEVLVPTGEGIVRIIQADMAMQHTLLAGGRAREGISELLGISRDRLGEVQNSALQTQPVELFVGEEGTQ